MRGTYGDKEKKKEKKKKALEQAANLNKKPTVSWNASCNQKKRLASLAVESIFKEKTDQLSKFGFCIFPAGICKQPTSSTCHSPGTTHSLHTDFVIWLFYLLFVFL